MAKPYLPISRRPLLAGGAAVLTTAAAITGVLVATGAWGAADSAAQDAASSSRAPITSSAHFRSALEAQQSAAAASSAEQAASAAAQSAAEAAPTEAPVTPWSPYTNPSHTAPNTVLPLGQTGSVGDFQVTVTSVKLNGNAIVASGNQFNDPPKGQYVVASLTVTYEGAREGMPAAALHAVYLGSDNVLYTDYQCSQVMPQGSMSLPPLSKGGTASYQVCMDVPPAAITAGRFFVEPAGASGDDRVFWSLQ
jgi:hypothetical protein